MLNEDVFKPAGKGEVNARQAEMQRLKAIKRAGKQAQINKNKAFADRVVRSIKAVRKDLLVAVKVDEWIAGDLNDEDEHHTTIDIQPSWMGEKNIGPVGVDIGDDGATAVMDRVNWLTRGQMDMDDNITPAEVATKALKLLDSFSKEDLKEYYQQEILKWQRSRRSAGLDEDIFKPAKPEEWKERLQQKHKEWQDKFKPGMKVKHSYANPYDASGASFDYYGKVISVVKGPPVIGVKPKTMVKVYVYGQEEGEKEWLLDPEELEIVNEDIFTPASDDDLTKRNPVLSYARRMTKELEGLDIIVQQGPYADGVNLHLHTKERLWATDTDPGTNQFVGLLMIHPKESDKLVLVIRQNFNRSPDKEVIVNISDTNLPKEITGELIKYRDYALKKRNFIEGVRNLIDDDVFKPATASDLNDRSSHLEDLPCPNCGGKIAINDIAGRVRNLGQIRDKGPYFTCSYCDWSGGSDEVLAQGHWDGVDEDIFKPATKKDVKDRWSVQREKFKDRIVFQDSNNLKISKDEIAIEKFGIRSGEKINFRGFIAKLTPDMGPDKGKLMIVAKVSSRQGGHRIYWFGKNQLQQARDKVIDILTDELIDNEINEDIFKPAEPTDIKARKDQWDASVPKSYAEWAMREGLSERMADAFGQYMTIRWGDDKLNTGYGEEWMQRFRSYTVWDRSDNVGRAALIQIGYNDKKGNYL